ncbi:MAG: efflux RND transporter periplasmic adaptor subunit [Proteobacteria bacterium]|nr:efflux RND transporter periplasmic adaptor subunit [Pseudomonadota bacterium]MBS0574702.1 efflux RND transporter periplasmic adaptor subunit [Pseudomonadota bacterium]
MNRKAWRSFAKFAAAAQLSALVASAGLAQQAPLPTVTTVAAATGDYTLTSRLPGRIKASTVSDVRPQVSGIIRERLFEEGTWVKKDQPLYKIEDETYLANVAAARAAVAQAQASYDLTILDANRAEDLFRTNAASAATRDKAIAARDAGAAALQVAKAQLSSAEIELDRTTIRAPVAGVIGLSQTTTGALVGAQQATALVTIRTLDPAYVDVTQSANDLLRWTSTRKAREEMRAAQVALLLPNGDTYAQKGHLLAAEPHVEPTTGMVTLRITFPNPDFILLPGLYVEVEMPQATMKNTVPVPQNAVMRDAHGGASVWVVEDGKIAVRAVKILGSSGNNWITTDGLRTGDQIVTSGFQKAGPGAEVQIVPANGDAAAPSGGN